MGYAEILGERKLNIQHQSLPKLFRLPRYIESSQNSNRILRVYNLEASANWQTSKIQRVYLFLVIDNSSLFASEFGNGVHFKRVKGIQVRPLPEWINLSRTQNKTKKASFLLALLQSLAQFFFSPGLGMLDFILFVLCCSARNLWALLIKSWRY